MKKCIIFGALEIKEELLNISDDTYIIAVDAGLKTVNRLNLIPDLIIGDFDSLGEKPNGENVIVHPIMKDDTDTMLALKTALNAGYKNFDIYGCLGGRLDQTIASIQTAAFLADNDCRAVFFDGETRLTVIKNGKISFDKSNEGTISVFAICGDANGVTETNLLYSLNNATITPEIPIGVSNEFIGENADIQVESGKLCVVWNGSHGSFNL